MPTTGICKQYVTLFARTYNFPSSRLLLKLCKNGSVSWERGYSICQNTANKVFSEASK